MDTFRTHRFASLRLGAASLLLAAAASSGPLAAAPAAPASGTAARPGVERDAATADEGRPRGHRHHGHALSGSGATVPAGVVVPSWEELGPERQRQLAHLREAWDGMPASRRVRALERLERHARWEALPPGERERLREGARNFRDLPPELREKMRTSYHALRALPEEERQRLQARWRALDPQQRRAWLERGGPGVAPEPAAD